jgi:hypothetical protein
MRKKGFAVCDAEEKYYILLCIAEKMSISLYVVEAKMVLMNTNM